MVAKEACVAMEGSGWEGKLVLMDGVGEEGFLKKVPFLI